MCVCGGEVRAGDRFGEQRPQHMVFPTDAKVVEELAQKPSPRDAVIICAYPKYKYKLIMTVLLDVYLIC